jgi:hypothetical protein
MKWNEIFGTTRGGAMINLFLDGNGPPTKSIKLTDAFLESAITGEVIKTKMGTPNAYNVMGSTVLARAASIQAFPCPKN